MRATLSAVRAPCGASVGPSRDIAKGRKLTVAMRADYGGDGPLTAEPASE